MIIQVIFFDIASIVSYIAFSVIVSRLLVASSIIKTLGLRSKTQKRVAYQPA